MVHEAAAMDGPSLVQGLLQRVEHEAGVCGPGTAPKYLFTAVGEPNPLEMDLQQGFMRFCKTPGWGR